MERSWPSVLFLETTKTHVFPLYVPGGTNAGSRIVTIIPPSSNPVFLSFVQMPLQYGVCGGIPHTLSVMASCSGLRGPIKDIKERRE